MLDPNFCIPYFLLSVSEEPVEEKVLRGACAAEPFNLARNFWKIDSSKSLFPVGKSLGKKSFAYAKQSLFAAAKSLGTMPSNETKNNIL